jgi:hypothetical protein
MVGWLVHLPLGSPFPAFVLSRALTAHQDLPETDIFVCENRYTAKSKSISRIKMWPKQLREVRGVADRVCVCVCVCVF